MFLTVLSLSATAAMANALDLTINLREVSYYTQNPSTGVYTMTSVDERAWVRGTVDGQAFEKKQEVKAQPATDKRTIQLLAFDPESMGNFNTKIRLTDTNPMVAGTIHAKISENENGSALLRINKPTYLSIYDQNQEMKAMQIIFSMFGEVSKDQVKLHTKLSDLKCDIAQSGSFSCTQGFTITMKVKGN